MGAARKKGRIMLSALVAFACIAAPAKVNVISAVYGAPDDGSLRCNVTKTVQSVLNDPFPRIVVTNQEMGCDPAPEEHKQLCLYYNIGTQAKQAILNEGETLRLKVNRSVISVTHADYGVLTSPEKTVDVTDKVIKILFDKRFRFVATPNELGVGDPAPGAVKKLTITYSVDGERYTESVDEFKTFFFDPARR